MTAHSTANAFNNTISGKVHNSNAYPSPVEHRKRGWSLEDDLRTEYQRCRARNFMAAGMFQQSLRIIDSAIDSCNTSSLTVLGSLFYQDIA